MYFFEKREREREHKQARALPPAGSRPKYLQQLGLGEAEAGNQELTRGLPCRQQELVETIIIAFQSVLAARWVRTKAEH